MDELPQAILVEDEAGPPGNEPLDVAVPEPPPRSANWLDLLIVLAVAWSVELVLAVVLVVAAGGPDLSRVPLGLLAASLIGWAVTLSVAWLFVCRKYGKSFAEGFAVRGVAWWLVLASVAIGVVASVLATLILSALPEGESLMTKLAKQPMGLFVLIAIALVLPPLEELYYRGFLYPILASSFGALATWLLKSMGAAPTDERVGHVLGGIGAVVVVSIWFGAVHIAQLAGTWMGIPIVFTMGVIWTVMRHRTGSVVPGMVCHFSYNLGLVVITLVAG